MHGFLRDKRHAMLQWSCPLQHKTEATSCKTTPICTQVHLLKTTTQQPQTYNSGNCMSPLSDVTIYPHTPAPPSVHDTTCFLLKSNGPQRSINFQPTGPLQCTGLQNPIKSTAIIASTDFASHAPLAITHDFRNACLMSVQAVTRWTW